MTDRELLELAAKAAGIELWHEDVFTNGLTQKVSANGVLRWNPLTNDGDALRLAVKLQLGIELYGAGASVKGCHEMARDDIYAATRRAIVRAAAGFSRTNPE